MLNHRKLSVRLTHQASFRRLKVSTFIVTKVYWVKSEPTVRLFFYSCQIEDEAAKFGRPLGVRTVSVIGGVRNLRISLTMSLSTVS